MTREFERLEPGQRYTVGANGVPVKQKSRSNRGLCIDGIATKYDSIMFESSDRYINVQPGAFAHSMKYEVPVECRLDHNPKLVLKDCRVELLSDEEAMYFRVHLQDSEICNQARDLIEAGLYTQCSLGWHSSKTITRAYLAGLESGDSQRSADERVWRP